MTTQWIMDVMEAWAPARWAMESDNVGLIIGDRARPVNRVLTALDLSEEVLREAVHGHFDFIITHHPLITRHVQPINRITADNALGKKILTLIGCGIGLFCAHTNLDMAPGGVNDILFECLDLKEKEPLIPPENPDFPTLGLIGKLSQPMTLAALADHVSRMLSINMARYVGRGDLIVESIGLCSGNGTQPQMLQAVLAKKCDVYITGDIGYHMAMDALENGLALIDGTHYATEIPVAEVIAQYIKKAAEEQGFELTVERAKSDGQVFKSTYVMD